MNLLEFIVKRARQRNLDLAYLGQFGYNVDQARRDNWTLVATNCTEDPEHHLASVINWCHEHKCQCFWDRVIWDDNLYRYWQSNSIGGEDILFIRTKDRTVAFLAGLRWS